MGLQQSVRGPREIRRQQVTPLSADRIAQSTARPRPPRAGGFFFPEFSVNPRLHILAQSWPQCISNTRAVVAGDPSVAGIALRPAASAFNWWSRFVADLTGSDITACVSGHTRSIPPSVFYNQRRLSMSAEPQHQPESSVVRSARPGDAVAISELLLELGYPSSTGQVEQRIAANLSSTGTAVFIAESDQRLIGVLSFHCIPLFHADGALGRITSLVVATDYRQRGIGRLLVSAAEEYGWAHGCTRVEVTSGDHRSDAHAFYQRLGYQADCRRFIKHGRNA
jgi:GNAT superfamily N-acetyltransferase